MRAILFGGITGALLVYFLDPKKGTDRRSWAGSVLNRGRDAAQNVGGPAQTIIRQTVFRGPDNPNPDDNTLKDRIESEVFRDPRFSREHVNILVVDGIVDLHGQLPTQDQIDTLISQVEKINNVKGVQSYLHLPGTPAPNKEESLEVSS
jgi:osmotically-inducible protein OsmY